MFGLTVSFDQVTVNGRDFPMRGTVTQASRAKASAAMSGAPAPACARSSAGSIVGAVKGPVLGVVLS